ncbi:hypothetical protein D5R81_11575 [Parashewanella spongiae]|uniref:Uncharacterized protein n=1 Tax=Parashewanella spongiae TaxID=342950 RepID=A0A3A6TD86_9GAMM|nr:hypothetical protein [Parashewanella spongiae]MCL1079789.1 hypothetical protein [Parashewanella spongiae]RJY13209.1 hypothetical protein D5R81_11575 [Parashewanella spongiae]
MSLVCSHCSKSIRVTKVEQHRGEGLAAQIRCYHCEAWLGKSARVAKVKMISFYLVVALAVLGYSWEEYRTLSIIGAILAGMTLLVSHFMDHLFTVEAPEQKDNSDELRKYR